MADSDTIFTGNIAALYDRYLGPLLFEPYAEDMARRMSSLVSGRVLEIAAGTGIVTAAIRRALPSQVSILATDLNQPMIDHAAERRGANGIEWRQADAQSLDFGDGSFDVAICQFGVMFFPDKVKAFGEAFRVLRPGGSYLFSVWDRIAANEISKVVEDAVAELFPADPPRFLSRTPYGHHDPAPLAAMAKAAGFSSVAVETVTKRSRVNAHSDVAIGLCHGSPLRAEIEARAPGKLQDATALATAALERRFGAAPFDANLRAQVLTAVK